MAGLTTLIPALITNPLNNYKYVGLSAAVMLWSIVALAKKNTFTLPIIFLDFGWLFFLSTGFLSFFWATNGSLVWYPAFAWLIFILWMLLVRSTVAQNNKEHYWFNTFALLFFLGALQFIYAAVNTNLAQLETWNRIFWLNANNTASYFVAFSSFLLFYPAKSLLKKGLKLLGVVFICYVLYLSNAKGAMLAFSLIGCYYLWTKLAKNYFLLLLKTLGTVFSFLLVALFLWRTELYQSLSNVGVSDRLFMIRRSIEVFLEYPLSGIGLGNWQTVIYNGDMTNISGFNHPIVFIRLGNHNLYSQLLAEVGILGCLAFLCPILVILLRGWKDVKTLSELQKAAVGGLMAYLTCSFFYRDTNIYELHFSSLQLIGFSALGILTSDANLPKLSALNWKKIIFCLMALLCFSWFVYFQYTHHIYYKAFNASKVENKKKQAEYYDSTFELTRRSAINFEYVDLIEQIYHPNFKTTHGFANNFLGVPNLLALHLAFLYEKEEAYDKAEKNFLIALNQSPNNEYALLGYAKFLLRSKKNIKTASKYAKRAYSQQQNHLDTNALMAEIAIAQNDFKLAKSYLNILKLDRRGTHKYLLALMLADIAIQELDYEQARLYLKPYIRFKKGTYFKLINNLNQQIEQATKKAVK